MRDEILVRAKLTQYLPFGRMRGRNKNASTNDIIKLSEDDYSGLSHEIPYLGIQVLD